MRFALSLLVLCFFPRTLLLPLTPSLSLLLILNQFLLQVRRLFKIAFQVCVYVCVCVGAAGVAADVYAKLLHKFLQI